MGSSLYGHGERGSGKDRSYNKDEMTEYKSRLDIVTVSGGVHKGGGGESDVELLRGLETVETVAEVEKRWESSWASSLVAS